MTITLSLELPPSLSRWSQCRPSRHPPSPGPTPTGRASSSRRRCIPLPTAPPTLSTTARQTPQPPRPLTELTRPVIPADIETKLRRLMISVATIALLKLYTFVISRSHHTISFKGCDILCYSVLHFRFYMLISSYVYTLPMLLKRKYIFCTNYWDS